MHEYCIHDLLRSMGTFISHSVLEKGLKVQLQPNKQAIETPAAWFRLTLAVLADRRII